MFNSNLFSEQVKSERGQRSLREAAKETGISASTLSRIEKGYIPNVNTFLVLLAWMDQNSTNYVDLDKYHNLREMNHAKDYTHLSAPV